MAAETPESGAPPRAAPSGGGGSAFTRKLGPLPVWAWMGVALGVALAYSMWRKNKKAAATAAASTAATAGTETTPTADQTPPFIIQNYTSNAAPNQTPTTPTAPPVTTRRQRGTPPPNPGGPITAPPPATTPPPPAATPPANPTSSAPPAAKTPAPTTYRVKPGDTLTSIAAKYGVSEAALWAYNIGTGPGTANRPAATIQTLKDRGQNYLVSNEEIFIP